MSPVDVSATGMGLELPLSGIARRCCPRARYNRYPPSPDTDQGKLTHFDASTRRKVASMEAFLRAAGHDLRYDILVIEANTQARIVTYAASVIRSLG